MTGSKGEETERAALAKRYFETARSLVSESRHDRFVFDTSTIDSKIAEPLTSLLISNWSSSGATTALQLDRPEIAREFEELNREALESTTKEEVSVELSAFQYEGLALQSAQGYLTKAVEAISVGPKPDSEKVEYYLDRLPVEIDAPSERVFGLISRGREFLGKLKDSIKEVISKVKSYSEELKGKLIEAVSQVIRFFSDLVLQFFNKLFDFCNQVSEVARNKGFNLKTIAVSVDPPTIEMTNVLGYSLPMPKISLPKLELDFDSRQGGAQP